MIANINQNIIFDVNLENESQIGNNNFNNNNINYLIKIILILLIYKKKVV